MSAEKINIICFLNISREYSDANHPIAIGEIKEI
ncbi:Uncharacterised protein [Clostridium cochlearium]|jgi:hypothetical protein|nr:hypothetical protein PP176A_0124 [Sporanaerobacter sp. PP17-6a]STA93534.1 Uncharacterised protein [Clostridium cochlearium]